MHILGIDEATSNTGLHINQVELYNTGDIAPVFLVKFLTRTLLGGQLQIDTRSQSHLVHAVTIVTPTFLDVASLPVVEGCCTVCLGVHRCTTVIVCRRCCLVVRIRGIISNTFIAEVYVAGEGT